MNRGQRVNMAKKSKRHTGGFILKKAPKHDKNKPSTTPFVNCTPFVRQYGILSNKWGVLLCQKEYQTNDIRRNSRSW